jgi:DNA-directed RNA polymerase specialized sigma24 family protein
MAPVSLNLPTEAVLPGADPLTENGHERLSPSLHHLPLELLLQEAGAEISRFRQKQPTTGMASFEIFRRALLLRDEAAWEGLYQLYAPLVEAWLLLHSRGRVLEAEELAGLVNETLAKFARALPAQKWASFATTPSLLAYLKCCATSVAADSWRQQRRREREAPLEAIDHQRWLREDPAETVMNRQSRDDLWQAAASVAQSEAERLILHQHYQQGVPLREFPARYPHLFPTIQNVYRSQRRLLGRLRRSRAVRQAVGLGHAGGSREAGRPSPTNHPTTKREPSQKGTTP